MNAKLKTPVADQLTMEITDRLISQAVSQNVSDLHFEIFENRGRVRFRIDGILKTVDEFEKEKYFKFINRLKEMGEFDIDQKRVPQDGRIIIKVKGKEIDLRMSTTPCIFGENMTIKVLAHPNNVCLDLNRACLNKQQRKTLESWYKRPNGVVLTTGPIGSGKTTLLYMMINELNKDSSKIISIEDPVEYALKGVCQIPVNAKAGLTFPRAMRSSLRSDPDIMMISEIRDLTSAQLIIQTSLIGHLVLSSLHTNNATEGVIRLLDMGIDPFLIKESLNGIISQRLVRALCSECKEKYTPNKETQDYLGVKKQQFYKAVGCSKCNNSGYQGRTPIFELFELSNVSKNLLLKKCSSEELRQQAIKEGMQTLFQDGIAKATEGKTSLEEVLRVLGNRLN